MHIEPKGNTKSPATGTSQALIPAAVVAAVKDSCKSSSAFTRYARPIVSPDGRSLGRWTLRETGDDIEVRQARYGESVDMFITWASGSTLKQPTLITYQSGWVFAF